MAYCDICGNYDDEHTDGEPSMMRGRNYKPLLDYYYSVDIIGKDWAKYDWSHFLPNTDCMCEQCLNAYDRLGKIKHKVTDTSKVSLQYNTPTNYYD